MTKFLKILLFSLGVFVTFSILTIIIKVITHHVAGPNEILGFFTKSDLYLGVIVSIVITATYEKRKKLRK